MGRLTCQGPPQDSGQSCEAGKKTREWKAVSEVTHRVRGLIGCDRQKERSSQAALQALVGQLAGG